LTPRRVGSPSLAKKRGSGHEVNHFLLAFSNGFFQAFSSAFWQIFLLAFYWLFWRAFLQAIFLAFLWLLLLAFLKAFRDVFLLTFFERPFIGFLCRLLAFALVCLPPVLLAYLGGLFYRLFPRLFCFF